MEVDQTAFPTLFIVLSFIALAVVVGAAALGRMRGGSGGREEQEEQEHAPSGGEDGANTPRPTSWEAGLGKTREEGFVGRLAGLFRSRELDSGLMEEVEEVLLTADIGSATANRLIERVNGILSGGEKANADRVWGALREEATAILDLGVTGQSNAEPPEGPRVVMLLGVNGSGKTTTIGKLAHRLREDGRNITLIAGDTFRAAAAEQLEQWGRRVGAPVTRGKEGADPASVVFDGLKAAAEEGVQDVLVDTAGRLHTQVNLMEELKKVRRVMGKAVPGAPHEVWLVVDATTGQNAIQQARVFHEATQVTGIVLTKLDGTAKGGVVLGVCDILGLPVRYVGIGERVEDLRPFDPAAFVDALFGMGPGSGSAQVQS